MEAIAIRLEAIATRNKKLLDSLDHGLRCQSCAKLLRLVRVSNRKGINGRIEKFEEHKWQVVEALLPKRVSLTQGCFFGQADDEGRLPKLHSQVVLFRLLPT